MQDLVSGLQRISQQSEASPGHIQASVMDELKAAAALQRKLFLFMLASQDPSQEASVQSVLLHTTTLNLQQPWQVVRQSHENMLVG